MSALSFLTENPGAVLVRVASVAGSTPRDVGAWMLVAQGATYGTVGGGEAEHRAMQAARDFMVDKTAPRSLDLPLGPEIGQCCGGRMVLELCEVTLDAIRALDNTPPQVFIFGSGHVGHALAKVLEGQEVSLRLIDERGDFPGETVAAPEMIVRSAEPGASYVVTTHSHAMDFLIASEALKRGDAAYVGMIGSQTKRARFESWLRENEPGIAPDKLICPMGATGLGDKRPQVIALHVAAEVMGALR